MIQFQQMAVFFKAKCGRNHRGLDFESQNMAMHEDS
jgi:hypothetical protein